MFHFYILQIRALKSFCRKVIIMDGAHLKGDFKGTILHAVAMDGNNQILPLAHGICKKESGLTWTWFLEKLYECVGDCQELTFVTDRADAIRVSIENVFPHAHHGLCAFHILGNIVPLLEFFRRLSQEWCNKRRIEGGMNFILTLIRSNN